MNKISKARYNVVRCFSVNMVFGWSELVKLRVGTASVSL